VVKKIKMNISRFALVLVSLFPFFNVSLIAQITIESSDFPGKADTVRYTLVTDFTIDYQSTGPESVWDFSFLGGDEQELIEHLSVDDADMLTQSLFGSTVMPSYRATYYLPATAIPFGELGGFMDIPIEDFYRFYRKTPTAMNVVGLSLAVGEYGLGSRSDTIELAYQFPMTYGQECTSRGYTFLDLTFALPAQLKQYRQRVSEVDGYGEITTPYGTFDAIRIHQRIEELDSIYYEFEEGVGQWFTLPGIVTHEYEWWAKDQNGPVLRIVTNEVFEQEQITDVRYRDSVRTELIADLNNHVVEQFVLYPNPSSDVIAINSSREILYVLVYDLNGKVLMRESGVHLIDVSSLEKGLYLVKVCFSNYVSANQFFVKN
jgi:hypothetical protein